MSSPATSAAAGTAAVQLNRHTDSALTELGELSPLYQRPCLELLARIINAVLAAPTDPKYRRLNAHKLRPKLRTDAAFKLLESIGFVPAPAGVDEEEFMSMDAAPDAAQTAVLQMVRDKLQAMIDTAETPPTAAAATPAGSRASPAAASASGSVGSPLVIRAPRQLYPQEGDTVEDATHVLFWHAPSWCAQWSMVDFEVDGIRYVCPEQYMMASKARLFGDHAMFAKICTSASPREHKKLGRMVKNFDGKVWDAHAFDIVVRANYAKFTQHDAFRQRLLATKDKVIVEASPLDAIWGVGMAANDPHIRTKSKWRGKNLLGEAIMKVRAMLREEEAQQKQRENDIVARKAAGANGAAR